jgi:hypothetical protein
MRRGVSSVQDELCVHDIPVERQEIYGPMDEVKPIFRILHAAQIIEAFFG